MENINWEKIEKIFFVGIKGVGMMPLSLIAKEYGFEIGGSDIPDEFITDEVLNENKVKICEGFVEKDIEDFFRDTEKESSLVITTGAHSGYDNPQVKWAKENNISVLNQGQALGIFMTGKPFNRKLKGLTITGSHGKTTVSAMMASAFVNLNLDPSYAVGTSKIFPIGNAGHYGKGEYFIAEGDEYVGEPVYDRTPKILYQKPNISVINNIDFDHPDVYKDLDDVKRTVLEFINNIESYGTVFLNSDDSNLTDIKNSISRDLKVISYGKENADYTISNIENKVGSIKFQVSKNGEFFSDFEILIPGIHNVYNSLAVICVLDSLGIEKDEIRRAINLYRGCKRRMELVGETKKGVKIIDDYGHHPKEIKSTLKALKDFYNEKIVCVFQSHTYSRTKEFLDEFSNSFGDVQELILLPIFKSQRDTESDIVSSEEFASVFKKNVKKVYLATNINDAANYINNLNLENDVIIVTIGAGDVYKVGYKLVK